MGTVTEQFKRHSVALISLSVALIGLGYNTWRNEQTEANRNVRQAGMQTLLLLGELDRVRFFTAYDSPGRDTAGPLGDPKSGWAYVLTIRDLGALLPERGMTASKELFTVWRNNFERIATDDGQASESISVSIDNTRKVVLEVLETLD